MIGTLIIHGFINYKSQVIKKRDGGTDVSLYGTISSLVNGHWTDLNVSALGDVAKAIINSLPMEEVRSRKQCLLTCNLNTFWSTSQKKWFTTWQIVTFSPIFTKKEEIVAITGVDKDLESRPDYSRTEEINLGPSDNDWDV